MAATQGFGPKRGLAILLSLLLWLSATVVQAAPAPTASDAAAAAVAGAVQGVAAAAPSKPPFPSLQDCKDKFKAPAKDQSIYFTGLVRSDINKVKDYAVNHGLVHVGLSYPVGWTNPGQYSGTAEEQRTWQENFSRLYAEGTSGDAYLMMDSDKSPASDSIFGTVEFPAMRDGGKVDKILQFNFTNPPDKPKDTTKRFWPDDAGAAMLTPPPGNRKMAKRFWPSEE